MECLWFRELFLLLECVRAYRRRTKSRVVFEVWRNPYELSHTAGSLRSAFRTNATSPLWLNEGKIMFRGGGILYTVTGRQTAAIA